MTLILLAGILWGGFVVHNVEQTDYFKCKYDKIESSCQATEAKKQKE